MTVNYKGMDADYNYRTAEISFEDKELHTIERIATTMEIKGYSIDIITDCLAICKVENKEEYNEFMANWKECKKSVKLWEKFGI